MKWLSLCPGVLQWNNYALLYISWGCTKKKVLTFLVAVCANLELQMLNNNKSKALFLFEFLILSSNSEVLIPFFVISLWVYIFKLFNFLNLVIKKRAFYIWIFFHRRCCEVYISDKYYCYDVFTSILWCAYLFIFLVVLGCCCSVSFSLVAVRRVYSCLRCMGFSLRWPLLLQNMI